MTSQLAKWVIGYLFVGLGLLALLALNVGLAYLPLGPTFSPVVALIIAAIQASLVGLFFMHLWGSQPLTRIFAAAGLLWLTLLIGLIMSDFITRGPTLINAKPPVGQIERGTD